MSELNNYSDLSGHQNYVADFDRLVGLSFSSVTLFLLVILFFTAPMLGFVLPGLGGVLFIIHCLVFLLFTWILLTKWSRLTDHLLSVILTLAWCPIYWLLDVTPLGDNWLAQVQIHPGCMFSEALGVAYLKILYLNGLWYVTPYIAPASGSLTTYFALRILFLLTSKAPESHVREWRFFAVCLFVSTGGHLIFFKGYLETTQLAVPFAVISSYLLLKHIQTGLLSYAIYSAGFFSLAFLMHASNIFWFPVFFILPVYVSLVVAKRAFNFNLLIPGLLSIILIIIVLMILNEFEGFEIFAGGAAGGGDGRMFVPLFEAAGEYERYVIFSKDHLSDVGAIFSVTNFLFLFAGPLYVISWKRLIESNRCQRDIYSLFFILLFLAHFTLAFFWNFDLGFPHDFDLMVSMGILWLGLPLILIMMTHSRPPLSAWFVLIFGQIVTWLHIGIYLLPG